MSTAVAGETQHEPRADGTVGEARLTAPRRTLRGTLLLGGLGVLGLLPERPLTAAAEAVGELWYRATPRRAALARANLARVCEAVAATGRGTSLARRAASDPDALERLVRAAYRHTARYYLEVARAGRFDLATAIARIHVETPDVLAEATEGGRQILVVGMHFGAIELPVVLLGHYVGHPVTAPMEMVEDPDLRRWFLETRGHVGIRIIPLANARRALLAAVGRGESIGLVADRDLNGSGLPVPFFGHPAPLPGGPALLAIETGLPVYVIAARRAKGGRYIARLIHVPAPAAGGSRRDRMLELTASMAAAFEEMIATAPEQWWGAFHPIWPDLEPEEAAA